MKKIILSLFLLIITTQQTLALDYNTYIKNKCDTYSIKSLLNSQVKYANKTNLNKLLSTYDDNYFNGDGLNKEAYAKLVEGVWETYPNLQYGIKIKDIKLDGNDATVLLTEFSNAYIPVSLKISGNLKSESDSEYKLKKINGKWKVTYDNVLSETTSMLYGEAKNLDIKLYASDNIEANKEYTASLEFVPPKNTIAMASIAKETVEYPQKTPKEVFRKFPDDYLLERLFIANNENKNEYIIASIGLARANIDNHTVKFDLSGFGYQIIRVNIKNDIDNKDLTSNNDEK